MSKPQDFMVKVERKSLEDSFELVEQVIPIDVVLPASYFQKITHYINKHCKSLETFIVKAYCTVETNLAIRKFKVEQVFKVTIEHMVNFNNVVLNSTTITIDKL